MSATNKIKKAAGFVSRVALLHTSKVVDVKRVGPGTCTIIYEDKTQKEVTGTVGALILSGDLARLKKL